jgi:hypothetical protein
MPDALALDRGIEIKSCCRWRRGRVTKINAVTVRITAKAELQTRWLASSRTFDTIVTLSNATRYCLGTSPKCRRKSTLPGEGRDDGVQSCLTQQPQGAIQTRFSTAISAGDQVQPVQRQDKITQRSVARNSEGSNHLNRIAGAGCMKTASQQVGISLEVKRRATLLRAGVVLWHSRKCTYTPDWQSGDGYAQLRWGSGGVTWRRP